MAKDSLSFMLVLLISFIFVTIVLKYNNNVEDSEEHVPQEQPKDKEIEAPTSFLFSQCGDSKKLPIQIKKFSISPDPLVLPGIVKFKLSLKVKEEVVGPIKVSLTMEKHNEEGWYTLPCNEQGYGSCEYPDICPFLKPLEALCPKSIKEKGLNCLCPLQPGKYKFKTMEFPVTVGFYEGAFHLVARMTSGEGAALACLDTTILFQKGQPLDVHNDHVH